MIYCKIFPNSPREKDIYLIDRNGTEWIKSDLNGFNWWITVGLRNQVTFMTKNTIPRTLQHVCILQSKEQSPTKKLLEWTVIIRWPSFTLIIPEPVLSLPLLSSILICTTYDTSRNQSYLSDCSDRSYSAIVIILRLIFIEEKPSGIIHLFSDGFLPMTLHYWFIITKEIHHNLKEWTPFLLVNHNHLINPPLMDILLSCWFNIATW